MLIHISQVTKDQVRPGNLTCDAVAKLSQALGIEAFICTEDYEWYGFTEEEEGESCDVNWLHISTKLWDDLANVFEAYR